MVSSFHKSTTKTGEEKQNLLFQLWGLILLQILAMYAITLSDIYYRAEGEIFQFVYFTLLFLIIPL
jgi:hypothetical protein